MKIAISQIGGCSGKLPRLELFQKLQALGHTVIRVGQDTGTQLHPDYAKYNVQYVAIPLGRSNTNPIREISTLRKTRKVLQDNNIDGVIAYGIRTFPTVVIAARLAGVKQILCIVNGSGKVFRLTGWKGLLVKSISYLMLWVSFMLTNSILFQNPDDMLMVRRKRLLWRRNYTTVNGSGVNMDHYKFQTLPADPVFSMISRLTGSKGVNEYVQAARLVKNVYPEATFNLIGPIDTDYNDFSIDMNDLNRAVEGKIINLLGKVKDVRPYLLDCRVFVLPSYYPEGVPRSILEAMSMGRPIITANSPGCCETVIDEYNGFLIPPRDARALAAKMIWMIENPVAVEEMGRKSRILCEDTFDIHKVNAFIVSFIK